MKFLLFSLAIEKNNLDIPLATACLKASLQSCCQDWNLETQLLQGSLDESPEIWQEKIETLAPDILGLSCYIWNRDAMADLSHRLKKKYPGMIMIAGGAEISASALGFMKRSSADFLIAGEGEAPLKELLGFLTASQEVPQRNYWLRRQDSHKPVAAEPLDWAELPSPWLEGILQPGDYSALLWELARGCPFGCSFCFESRGNNKVRTVPEERIRKELRMMIEADTQEVFVLDPTFNYHKERCVKILEWLIEEEAHCHFTFEIRMEKIDQQQAELFSQLNCALQIGLQSSSPEISKNINRFLNPLDFQKKARMLRRYNIPFGLDLIYGLPQDSLKGFRESLNFALRLQPSNLEIFPLLLMEGTQLFDQAEQWGIVQGKEDFCGWQHPCFPAEDMRTAAYLAESVEIFYTWAMAADWLNLLADTMDSEPIEIMDLFSQWRLKNQSIDPGLFLEESFSDHKLWLPLRELIRLFHSFWQISRSWDGEEQNGLVLELQFTPDQLQELMESTVKKFLSRHRPRSSNWVIYLDDQGICWEESI